MLTMIHILNKGRNWHVQTEAKKKGVTELIKTILKRAPLIPSTFLWAFDTSELVTTRLAG